VVRRGIEWLALSSHTECKFAAVPTFTKSARATIIAASIEFLMRCHSVACGYAGPNAIEYAEHHSCSMMPLIRVYDVAGNVLEPQEHHGRV
jgi:hypothetical protein